MSCFRRTTFAWIAMLVFLATNEVIADETFDRTVQPFLKQFCAECHSGPEAEAELAIESDLTLEFNSPRTRELWGEVLNSLNSHQMPPADADQPSAEASSIVIDWITTQMVAQELRLRENVPLLRRLNRFEYQNTIRDLVGIEIDADRFPEDPAAGGFDNNGKALTLSPLHLEIFYDTARMIFDKAIITGPQPPSSLWKFEVDEGDNDSHRVERDGQRIIVNGGNNPVRDGFKQIHHANWDKGISIRDFRVAHEGTYRLRIRAAGIVPNRDAVVAAAEKILKRRFDDQMAKNPDRERWHREQLAADLDHFRNDRMYDYGPPRIKVIRALGGQPEVIAEVDVTGTLENPQVLEFQVDFTTEKAGLQHEYAYSLPRELENFWCQTADDFARPELLIDWVELEGPVFASWPPESHKLLLGKLTTEPKQPRAMARLILQRFLRRAWRRPVQEAEIESKLQLFDEAFADYKDFFAAIKVPLTASLVAPDFLFLVENSLAAPSAAAAPSPQRISNHQLACRLSYFLTSTMPDTQLSALADKQQLSDPKVLRQQVDRLLNSPASDNFVSSFAGQWLGLREVGSNPPAEDLFPRYDVHLEQSMIAESEQFFAHVLKQDLDVRNFLRSDFVVINERLARFYGIPNVDGDHFRPVSISTDIPRGGVLTHGSILTITSNGTRTSPVKRGTWVLKNILGQDPGLPVANAGEIAPKVPGIDKATVRQRLEIHRTLPQCARCHDRIDPLGFALENFNAAGEYRQREGFGYKGRIGRDDPLIDASGVLPDGTSFDGVLELQQALVERESLFVRCLTEKLMTYALGRELAIADRPHVSKVIESLDPDPKTLRALIQAIVSSEPFQVK